MPREGSATLVLPAGQNGPAFLATKNFFVIKSYNSSTAYALGVSLLSDRIAGEGPLKGTWPNEDLPTASLAR
jgi:membrane-bound lytic murein transglycosylase B